MTKIILLSNNKGGPGKTTAAYYLALRWACAHRVSLLDLDGQCNLTDMIAPATHDISISDVLANRASIEQAIAPVTLPTGETLNLVRAAGDLYDMEAELSTGLGVMRLYHALRNADDLLGDVCIIDTPPNLGALTLSAIIAVGMLHGWVIVPTIPTANSVSGILSVQAKINEAQQIPGCRPALLGVIATQTRGTNIHNKWLAALRSGLYPPLLGETPYRGGQMMEYELRRVYNSIADLIWAMTGGDAT
ncbi:MAG: ParA family protein [Desulfurellales bacterium]|nr:MAG: ParA family protein [Desulfurellales bacterium]